MPHLYVILILLLQSTLAVHLYKRQDSVPLSVLPSPEVTLKHKGSVRGSLIYFTGDLGTISAYVGIPYAEPPVDVLRFAKPVRHGGWTGRREATTAPPSCLQHRQDIFPYFFKDQGEFSEDCLFLNIFTPTNAVQSAVRKLPVIFYIHGGSFSNGDGITRDGSGLAAKEGVVVVSINYRLNMLGFMNYGEGVPKNIGLHDIIQALGWVQDNIERFGGCKQKVTIIGESAGAALVSFLHLSNKTRGLFSGSIALSGSLNAPWALEVKEHELRDKYEILLNKTRCLEAEHKLQCLRSRDSSTINEGHVAAYSGKYPLDVWPPVIDGDLVLGSPHQILERGDFDKTRPLMNGICEDEGGHLALVFSGALGKDLVGEDTMIDSVQEFRNLSVGSQWIVNQTIPCMNDGGREVVKLYCDYDNLAKYRYSDVKPGDPPFLKYRYRDFLGDWFIACSQTSLGALLAQSGVPVYQYVFNYTSASNDVTPPWTGVQHNMDMAYIFGLPFSQKSPYTSRSKRVYNAQDELISKRMMHVYKSFAAHGKPKLHGVHWEPFTLDAVNNPTVQIDIISEVRTNWKVNICTDLEEIVRRRAQEC